MIFASIVVLLFILATYSSFIDPLINQEMFVELPSEDDITWSLEDGYLLADTSLAMENNGFYDMQDIVINYDLSGLDIELFSDTIIVNSLSTGERIEIPISIFIPIDDFEDEVVEEIVFNTVEFKVSSHMTARYPLSLLHLELRHDEILEWNGLVQKLEFDHQGASVSSLPNQEGSILSIPYDVDTHDLLDGEADVHITMYDETMTTVYSTQHISVPLGRNHREDLEFELDYVVTEEFITNSQRINFVSHITFQGADTSFEYTTKHDWGAPLNDIALENFRLFQTEVRTSLLFENDSPRDIQLELNIDVFDSEHQLVGSRDHSFSVASGRSLVRAIGSDVTGDPLYAQLTFYEHSTGMEYSMEAEVDV